LAITFEPETLESQSNLLSKHSYYSRVSNKNSSQKRAPSGLDDVIHISINLLPLWRHRQKQKSKTFQFLSRNYKTFRIFRGFE